MGPLSNSEIFLTGLPTVAQTSVFETPPANPVSGVFRMSKTRVRNIRLTTGGTDEFCNTHYVRLRPCLYK